MPCLGYLTSVPDEVMKKWSGMSPKEWPNLLLDSDWRIEYGVESAPMDGSHELSVYWDDLDRVFGGSLTAFSVSDHGGKNYPFSHIIFGGRSLGDKSHIYILKTPEEVRAVSQALQVLDKDRFIADYFKPHEFDLEEDDQDLLWDVICEMMPFWRRAAERGEWVLFDAPQ